jgi:chromosomal replication initiation ATPase DnaA
MNINKLAVDIAELVRKEIAGEKHVCAQCVERNKANDAGLFELKALVCVEVGITLKQFESCSRITADVFARQLFVHIAINTLKTKASLGILGTFINKDHATVIHSRRKAEDLLDSKQPMFTALHNKIISHYA